MIQAGALALVLAQAQGPVLAQPDRPKADKAAEIASFGFMGMCTLGVMGAPTPANYAKNVNASAPKFLEGVPPRQVNIEGVDEKTCRVTYIGPDADRVFASFQKAANPGKGCVVQALGHDNLRVSCAPGLLMDGYEATIRRIPSNTDERVIGSITITARGLGLTGQTLQDMP